MASIVKRKSKYSVVYTYKDDKGEKRQKWETFATNAEAKRRKAEVEFQQESGTLVIPEAKTVKELLEDYTSIYGVNTWAMSTYEARRSLIFNYINPIIGDVKLSDLNTRLMEKYYQNLLKIKSRVVNNRKPNTEYLSCHTVREVHKLLRSAFNQAVKWELMQKNPCINATLPQEEHKARDIWDAPTLFKALELCDDEILKLAINLAFSCSLRIGEMLGLTWDCVEISDASIANGTAFIFVNKELQRVNRDALEKLNEKGIVSNFLLSLRGQTPLWFSKSQKQRQVPERCFCPKRLQKCSEIAIRKFRNTRNCSEMNFKILTLYFVVQTADRWRVRL